MTGQIPVHRIDMDLNSDARFGSHKLHTAAVGYIRAHGYEPHTKPDLLIAIGPRMCSATEGPKARSPHPVERDRGDVTLQIDL